MTYLDDIARRIESKVSPWLVPTNSADLFRLYALLVRAKGAEVDAEDVHDAWVAWMASKGESHRSMVEFSSLSPDVQSEDEPFLAAMRAVALEFPSE